MVMVPPKMAQKPIGMSKRDSGMVVRREIRLTTGKNKAAAPMFCMKLEIQATQTDKITVIRPSVLPATFNILPAITPITPVLSRPAPIIITAIIDITALDEKPSNN